MRHTATTLVDGRVLIAGGRTSATGADLDSTVFISAAGDELRRGPSLAVARSSAQAVPITGNGGVLMIGGVAGDVPLASTELLNADGTEFMAFGDLKLARAGLVASAVGDSGSVLSVGGIVDGAAIGVCGKTTGDSLQADRSNYVQGDTAVITGTWIEKEPVKVIATSLTLPGRWCRRKRSK